MAPPIGRQAAIDKVVAGELPFSCGPVMVLEQDGKFRIRQLMTDPYSLTARARSPSWMPEHHYLQGVPTGIVYAEADTLEELAEIMRTMEWPQAW